MTTFCIAFYQCNLSTLLLQALPRCIPTTRRWGGRGDGERARLSSIPALPSSILRTSILLISGRSANGSGAPSLTTLHTCCQVGIRTDGSVRALSRQSAKLFLQSSELGLPHPAGECPLSFGSGGGGGEGREHPLSGEGSGPQSTYFYIFLLEMKQGWCVCPLNWSVHCNFTGDGKCNGRGWACTPHPYQPGLILPSWWNVRQKADVTTLCTLWSGGPIPTRVISKKCIFFGILRATDDKSRIRIRRIRIQRTYGSKYPDPSQNVTDPEHCQIEYWKKPRSFPLPCN